jgi:gliding motility-associated-like protein
MCLNGGLGDVVVGQKGVLLGPSYAEKMVAIESGVAGEYWLVAHVLGGTDYHSFRVTGAGVNSTPVISSGSAFHGSTCMIGYMKSNHAGTKIITAQTFCNDVEMVDFDKSTGTVSNPVSVNAEAQIYGIEFSPDDQLFYLARNYTICEIYQFNTSTPTTAGLMIDTKPGTYAYGALQLAPDGRIYVARAGQGALDLISNPNVAGVGCGYVTDGFALAGGTLCQNGLPHFPQFRFGNPPPAGSVLEPSYFLDCQGLNFMGWVDDSTSGLTYTWSTSDTLTGGTSPSAGPSVSWVFSTSGPHTVTVIQSGCNPDTVTFVAEPQDTMPDLGGPYSVCFGDSVALTAFLPGAYYLWSTGESTASISVSQTGNYWVSVTSPCSTFVDSAKVEVLAGGGEATMANVFTPNADGINDQFCVGPEVNSADEFYLGVWDRWGRLLFETAQPGDCWSGKFNGKEEVDGVYFWVMRFKDCKGELNTVTGNVTLLR